MIRAKASVSASRPGMNARAGSADAHDASSGSTSPTSFPFAFTR